jgi:hypothetical protein
MAKNKVSEWSPTAANNTDISGINIAEGCAPSGINNAIRELMAQVKDMQAGTDADNFTVGGNLSVTGTTTLTGTTAAPTPSAADNSTKIATTAFVATEFASKDYLNDPNADGILSRTADKTVTARTITAGTGVTVTNGDGVSGNPTVAISNSGITANQLASNAVTTAKIADANITAAKLNGAQSGSAPIYAARAFGIVASNGTLSGGSNIASTTRTSEGNYTITFTTAMPSAVYAVVGSALRSDNEVIFNYSSLATTGFNVTLRGGGGTRDDIPFSFAVFA